MNYLLKIAKRIYTLKWVIVATLVIAVLFQPGAVRADGAPDCTQQPFHRCMNEGYFTGSKENDTIVTYPLVNDKTYVDPCSPSTDPPSSFVFPATTGCSNPFAGFRDDSYANTFINQMKADLDNYCTGNNVAAGVFLTSGTYVPNDACGQARRNGLGAAMTILTMRGRWGTDFGTDQWSGTCPNTSDWYTNCYNKDMNAGVNAAKSEFAKWKDIILTYNEAGQIAWGTDIQTFNNTDAEFFNSITVFDSHGGILFQINRSCGNLVGNEQPLKDLDASLDVLTCPNIAGWAWAAELGTGAVQLDFYFDSHPTDNNPIVVHITADNPRADVSTKHSGDHGFSFDPRNPPPSSSARGRLNILDGNDHYFFAYSTNVVAKPLYFYGVIKASDCSSNLDITASPGNVNLLPDEENPIKATFNPSFSVPAGSKVKNVKVDCSYTYKRGPSLISMGGSPTDIDLNPSYACNDTKLLPSSILSGGVRAGDRVCVDAMATPNDGTLDATMAAGRVLVVGSSGTVVKHGPGISISQTCATIINKPYTSFSGNDVVAGGNFGSCGTSGSSIQLYNKGVAPTWQGSSAQLAVRALGVIDGLASAKFRTTAPKAPDGLSFANTVAGVTYGGGVTGCQSVPDYFSGLFGITVDTANKAAAGVTVPTTTGDYFWAPANHQVILNSTSIPNSSHVKLYIEGDVSIAGNMVYGGSGAWTDPTQIPTFQLFVHGNIYIQNSATVLDGMYVSQKITSGANAGRGGTIETCGNGFAPQAVTSIYNNCSSQLVVHGSFTANHIDLLRSANTSLRNGGGDSARSSNAAEWFDFSPEAYIANYNDDTHSGTTSDVYYITTLPPVL